MPGVLGDHDQRLGCPAEHGGELGHRRRVGRQLVRVDHGEHEVDVGQASPAGPPSPRRRTGARPAVARTGSEHVDQSDPCRSNGAGGQLQRARRAARRQRDAARRCRERIVTSAGRMRTRELSTLAPAAVKRARAFCVLHLDAVVRAGRASPCGPRCSPRRPGRSCEAGTVASMSSRCARIEGRDPEGPRRGLHLPSGVDRSQAIEDTAANAPVFDVRCPAPLQSGDDASTACQRRARRRRRARPAKTVGGRRARPAEAAA